MLSGIPSPSLSTSHIRTLLGLIRLPINCCTVPAVVKLGLLTVKFGGSHGMGRKMIERRKSLSAIVSGAALVIVLRLATFSRNRAVSVEGRLLIQKLISSGRWNDGMMGRKFPGTPVANISAARGGTIA